MLYSALTGPPPLQSTDTTSTPALSRLLRAHVPVPMSSEQYDKWERLLAAHSDRLRSAVQKRDHVERASDLRLLRTALNADQSEAGAHQSAAARAD